MLTLPLILAVIPCFISVTLANNGCNDAMLEMRINQDFQAFYIEWDSNFNSDSVIPQYTVVRHCRAHSFTSPMWLDSTVLALRFLYTNKTFFTVLHYNSCNETTSMFADPIVLIPITMLNQTGDVNVMNNTNADFCYSCTDNVTTRYCNACDSTCMTEEEGDLDFCYGPSGDECCKYIENDNCTTSCEVGSSADETSTCIPDHLCTRENPCQTGDCTELTDTTYNCTCPNTHIGVNCSIVNLCNNMTQCNNNGNCSTSESDPYFTCNCVTGVTGAYCQHNMFCNDSVNPCMNNGMCDVTDADNYVCSCAPGYGGTNCETSLSTGVAPLTGVIAGVVVVFVVIAIIIVLIVILCVMYFYIKGKKGKVEISKKTSKVYPTNGNGTTAEKEPMLDKEKQ